MASTFSPNINLEEPARGDDVGTWDTPVNANMTLIDKTIGGSVTIALNNSPVVLAAAQFQAKTITFNSTLTGSVTITFPTTFFKSYEIINNCTGSSAFTITLITTNPGVNAIGVKPGDPSHVIYDGIQFRYVGLGMVGEYVDYAGSSLPNWVSACAVAPYLKCDGSVFSSATFPQLAMVLGTTTLPDLRGRNRYAQNDGTGRLTAAGAGIDGNTRFATGGSNGVTLAAANIPSGVTSVNASQLISVTPAANFILTAVSSLLTDFNVGGSGLRAPGNTATMSSTFVMNGSNSISVISSNAAQTLVQNAAPAMVAGITLIRAG